MEAAFEEVRALDCHRERLTDVKIVVFSAHASRNEDDEPRGEALARNGRPILGTIRISSLEDRAEGMADARVLLNGDRWGQLSAAMQRAVIDTCLTSLEVRQKDGVPQLDDLGRPKLQQRKWDFELVGFNDVAARHGASSVEVHNFKVLFDEFGQTYLPHFGAPDDRPVNYLAVAPKRPRTKAKEITKGSDAEYQRGPLAGSALSARIEHLKSAATLLAVAKLELQKKPRDPVIKAIKTRVLEMTILPDFIRITKGEDQDAPPVELDLDAAVLVTSPANLDLDTLDRLGGASFRLVSAAPTISANQARGGETRILRPSLRSRPRPSSSRTRLVHEALSAWPTKRLHSAIEHPRSDHSSIGPAAASLANM